MKKRLLGLVAIPLIAIGGLIYAENDLIVHDTTGGTITVYGTGADGKIYGITIQDKNLGASVTGTGTESYGYYFQWGNNHGNYAGTNTGTLNELLDADVSERVNKGYSGENNKFIIFDNGNKKTFDYRSGVYNTSTTDNSYVGDSAYNNLWGGGNDNDDSNTTIVKGYDTEKHVATNVTGRQGPCPEGYHVPSAGEWQELLKLYAEAKGYTLNTQGGDYAWRNTIAEGRDFSNDLKLPLAGDRYYAYGTVIFQGSYAHYWSSSPRGGSSPESAWLLSFNSSYVNPGHYRSRAYGQSLRCFKNEYEKYYKNNGEIIHNAEEGTITFVHGGEAITIMDKNIGAEHVGYWYDADEGSYGTKFVYGGELVELGDGTYELKHWENNPCEQIGAYIPSYSSGWQLLLDIWGKIRKGRTGTIYGGYGPEDSDMISKDFLMPVGRGSNSGIVLFASELKDRNDYFIRNFSINDFDGAYDLLSYTGDKVYLRCFVSEDVKYKVSYKSEGEIIKEELIPARERQDDMQLIRTKIKVTYIPQRDGYEFKGWETEDGKVWNADDVVQGNVVLKAKWSKIETKSSGGSSGGGGRSSRTSDKDKDTTNNPSVTDMTAPLESGAQGDSDDGSPLSRGDTASAERGSTQNYTQEFQQAYEFAHENGITTKNTIESADMNGKLTRIAMAKMLSQYAINILGKTPDTSNTKKFDDVSDKRDADYDNGVMFAYQLGIMGQNMANNFRPDDEVTRAEFATALSRMLYGTSDGEYKSTDKYYTNHMKKLVQEGIITNDDAKMKELRGYVMIMLMRSAK